MAAQILDATTYILGEDKNLRVTVTDADGASLSTATAVVNIVDSSGSSVVSNGSMTGSGTTSRVFTYLLTTGSGQTITAAGEYRATYIVTYGSQNFYFEQVIRVVASTTLSTTWPDPDDVYTRLASAGLTLRTGITSSYLQKKIDAVVADVTRRTHRSFVTVTETRYFDGSGTGVQEIDEYTDVTAVEFIGVPEVAGLTVDNIYEPERENYPKTTLQIIQGAPISGYFYINRFPQGRSNIKVTATWGYAATIPQDLWEAVAGEVASQLASEASWSQQGRLESWAEADTRENYGNPDPRMGLHWHKEYERAIRKYKRPFGQRLRKLHAPMI